MIQSKDQNLASILIIDAVATDIATLRFALGAQYQLHFAASASEALPLAKVCRPDLILLDSGLPGGGIELYRGLRGSDALAQVPVLVLTAPEGPAEEWFGLQPEVDDYLARPCRPEIVRHRAGNLLELRRQRSLLAERQASVPEYHADQASRPEQSPEDLGDIQEPGSVALLAGGIAHDFNNILTGIIGNISLAQMHLEPSSKAHGPLLEMERAAELAVQLTRQLLALAGEGDPATKAIFLKHLGSGAVSIALQGSEAPGASKAPDRSAEAPAPAYTRGGAILVMDDDQMIRTIATQMLECLGYRVTACENGLEAIELYQSAQEAGEPFDAVLMDLTVAGGMGGVESARHILALDPDARLVVSSGYNNARVMADFKTFGFCAAMPKPYRTSDLAGLLSKLFQERGRKE